MLWIGVQGTQVPQDDQTCGTRGLSPTMVSEDNHKYSVCDACATAPKWGRSQETSALVRVNVVVFPVKWFDPSNSKRAPGVYLESLG